MDKPSSLFMSVLALTNNNKSIVENNSIIIVVKKAKSKKILKVMASGDKT